MTHPRTYDTYCEHACPKAIQGHPSLPLAGVFHIDTDLEATSHSVGPFTQKARPSIHAISAIIRLGHKYQMQHMVAQAVRYLKRWFTSDFAVWSAGKLHLPDAPLKRVHAIGVVNLARLVDEPSLLPTALLACCLLDAQIVQGFAREDSARERLALDDVGRCFAARTRLAEEALVLTLRIFSPEVSDGCADPQMCEMLLGQTLASVAHEQRDFARADVFTSWVNRAADAGPLSCVNLMFQCCNSCQEMVKERDLEERLRVWKALPEIMGVRVDGWAASSP